MTTEASILVTISGPCGRRRHAAHQPATRTLCGCTCRSGWQVEVPGVVVDCARCRARLPSEAETEA